MKRLNTTNINTPDFANRIFIERWGKELNYIDWHRFVALAKYFRGGVFLDLGVFNSPLIIEFQKAKKFGGSEFIGLDYCESVIRELQARHPEVRYVVGDAMKLQFKDKHFDYIVAGELMEHMEDPVAFIKEAMRVLKVGSILALSIPKEEIKQGLVSREHLWSFDEQDVKILLGQYGKVEIVTFKEPLISKVEHFIVYCTKHE